jgi:hypothetical protein
VRASFNAQDEQVFEYQDAQDVQKSTGFVDDMQQPRQRAPSPLRSPSPRRTISVQKLDTSLLKMTVKAKTVEMSKEDFMVLAENSSAVGDFMARAVKVPLPTVADDAVVCPVCHAKLKRHAGLLKHMATQHTAEGRKRCDFPGCKKSYSTNTQLKYHKEDDHAQPRDVKSTRKAAVVKPAVPTQFNCSECAVVCASLALLAAHHRSIHKKDATTGEFKCEPGCGKAFSTKKKLSDHRTGCKRVPGFVMKSCIYCSCEYAKSCDLRVHMRNAHGM